MTQTANVTRHGDNEWSYGSDSLTKREDLRLPVDDIKPGFHLEAGESDTPLHWIPARVLSPGTRRQPTQVEDDHSLVSRKGPASRKAPSMALVHETDRDSTSKLGCVA